ILENDQHLPPLAGRILEAADKHNFCVENSISSNVLTTTYGLALKRAVLERAVHSQDVDILNRALTWVFSNPHGTPIAEFYEVLLSPFTSEEPGPELQKALLTTVVSKFGDPRIRQWPSLIGPNADVRREACVATATKWLSIEYLELFIKII